MSNLFATAGSKFFIGNAALAFAGTNFTQDTFNPTTWTEVEGVTNLGSLGDTAELITSQHIGSNRVRKLKGPRNAGSMTIIADLDYDDPGQLAVVEAEKSRDSWPFRVRFNDAPAGGTHSSRLFTAYVMSATESLDEASNTVRLTMTLEIDSNIVRVDAEEAP